MPSPENPIPRLKEPNREVDESTRREYHNIGANASLVSVENLRRLMILDSVFRYDQATQGPICQRALSTVNSTETYPVSLWLLGVVTHSKYQDTIQESAEQLYHPSSVEFIGNLKEYDLTQYIHCLEHFYRYEEAGEGGEA